MVVPAELPIWLVDNEGSGALLVDNAIFDDVTDDGTILSLMMVPDVTDDGVPEDGTATDVDFGDSSCTDDC